MVNFSPRKVLSVLSIILLTSIVTFAQTQITGTISDADTKEPLAGVSVQVKDKIIGTITDGKGEFDLSTSASAPFTLLITYIGYSSQEIPITAATTNLTITLEETAILGQEVVVSASRVEESVLKSAVAVEKMDIRDMQQNASSSFYDGLNNLKGIDLTTQGLLFKSVNMRGFGATGNVRTVQLIDGMDNQAPGLNFPVDNIVGMPDLDVESVEVLPGAGSALYGPNALNGIILMNSKSPFLYQGVSARVKGGAMVANNRSQVTTPFYEGSVRYAKAFNNKFAFKVNLSYLEADDWQATDYSNMNLGGVENGTRGPGVDVDYDGLNVYGDEVQTNMQGVADGLIAAGLLPAGAAGLIPNQTVSRTGYLERDLVDYGTKSFKTNVALHYRINDKIEAIGQFNYGSGTTVYTGTGRYSLRNFNISQTKLELKADNFTVRGYMTRENSGQSYLAGLAAIGILNESKSHQQWFGEYVGAFAGARGQGLSEEQAHLAARQVAQTGVAQPGSAEYDRLFNQYREQSIAEGGGRFLDKTNLYHAEGVYNFKNEIEFIDLLVGANFRQYQLRSEGTLFADQAEGRNGTIPINEFGAFAQAAKTLFKDHLKVTGSVRYDKNENFDGQFTPRVSGVATFGDQNFRASYQTGFRIPTTQNQYIDLTTPQGTLIGGLPEFDERYNLGTGILRQNLDPAALASLIATNPAILQQAQAYATAAVTSQIDAIQAAVIAGVQAQVTQGVTAQVNAAVAAGAIPPEAAAAAIAQGVADQMASAAIQQTIASTVQSTVVEQVTEVTTQVAPLFAIANSPTYQATALQPETISSWEIGYKGLIAKKVLIDAYYYQSKYTNFVGGTTIVVPTEPAGPGLPLATGIGVGNLLGYNRPATTKETIKASGWAIGLRYLIGNGYNIGANVANNRLDNFTPSPEQQYAGFNSPEYRYNISFGKGIGSGDKFGFNVSLRHQQAFTWETSFVLPTDVAAPLFTNTVVPAITNVDAQVSFKLPAIKSILKIGGTNIGGNPYVQAFGSASVGSMYYASITFDELLNR